MVEHFSIIYYGQEVRPLKAFVIMSYTGMWEIGSERRPLSMVLWRCYCRWAGLSMAPNPIMSPNRWDFSLELKKNEILGDKVNNQRFLNMFSFSLEKKGCTIIHIRGGGDIPIVQTARLHPQRMSTLSLLEMIKIFFNPVVLPWGCFNKGPIP